MATWLNTTFAGLDGGVFNIMHALANAMGDFLTPVCKIYTALGDGGLFFIALSIFLMFFRKTRRTGFAMLLAIGVGAVFTNLLIKKLVARPRPYVESEIYNGFWQFVGAHIESEFSFPSGHTTATMASMTAMFICSNKKWSWLGFVVAFLMAFTRVYFIVHYFTDVLGGFIIGAIGGIGGYYICKGVYKLLNKYKDKKAINFMLNACVLNLFRKKAKDKGDQE